MWLEPARMQRAHNGGGVQVIALGCLVGFFLALGSLVLLMLAGWGEMPR